MRRAGWVTVLAALAVLLVAPAGTSAKAHGTPQDRAATRAYLEAKYAYEQSLVATAPASTAAVDVLARGLASECPGVLAGAPRRGLGEVSTKQALSPRQQGEDSRRERQAGALEQELGFALELPALTANRQAALAYVHAVSALRWSSAAVTTLEHAGARELEWLLDSNAPAVCADMRSWAASGYTTLSAATRTRSEESEALVATLIGAVRELFGAGLSDPLARSEGPAEKALARKLEAIEQERIQSSENLASVYRRLEVTLGLVTERENEKLEAAIHNSPPKGSIEIGHGTTAAGSTYTVWGVPRQPGVRSQRPSCWPDVAVTESSRSGGGLGEVITLGGSRSETCLSHSHPTPPSSRCANEGRLTIEAQTLPGARSVRLNLSDGRHISSRAALVPASLGGPAGFYYQAVRTRSAFPTSFTEVGAQGEPLRTVKLRNAHKCPKPVAPRRPRRFTRTIASASVPQGPDFSIVGERSTFAGHTNFELNAEVSVEAGAGGILSAASGSSEAIPSPGGRPDPFAQHLRAGCLPHEYAILYGVLREPRDTVLARTSAGLQPLRQVPIPASLHVHGVLAYIALASVPSEVLVRNARGKIISRQQLADRVRQVRETCEGEAEPS